MNNPFLKFSTTLVVIVAFAFIIHIGILRYMDLSMFENKIVSAYSINIGLAILIFGVLFKLKNKYKEQLGFLFLGGSALKFVVFFIIFYPAYKADGNISKLEFAAFFVPYIICLVLETLSLSKWLNKME